MSSAGQSDQKNRGWEMMKKMGYEKGKGLGKEEQGLVEPIAAKAKLDRKGLGADGGGAVIKDIEALVYGEEEVKRVEEEPEWLSCPSETRRLVSEQITEKWIELEKEKDYGIGGVELAGEDRYCSRELIEQLLDAKSIFDTMDDKDLRHARARANPYETIKAGFFQNRAAMKTANLDKIYGWALSREFDECRRHAKNPLQEGQVRQNVDRSQPELFYFADVCAGPGGFSEYMLWRKAFYNAKGFGFTLRGPDDFKLERFKAAPAEYFEPFYGEKGDGDVMLPENLESLERFVKDRIHTREPSKQKGVHLVMCDGGFSVAGQENIQEVLSKRLYLCQFIAGLSLCRFAGKSENGHRSKGGNFLCKLFDVFTPFSIGLIYLMYIAFERISMHKPITSRPANSERYIFCESLTAIGATKIKQFMVAINNRLHENAAAKSGQDILEVVPDEIIQEDPDFLEYMRNSNEAIAKSQVFYLQKYRVFASNPGSFDADQADLRTQALAYWELPDFVERPGEGRHSDPRDRRQQHQEPAPKMFERYTTIVDPSTGQPQLQIRFPLKWRTSRLSSNELALCPDVSELRSLLLTESDEPVLLLSQGFTKLFVHRRNGFNWEMMNDLHTSIPADTILLAQLPTLYEFSETSNKLEPVGKCVWVLDAAVLNGDNVSQLDFKARLAAVRKFADSVNRLSLRRFIVERKRQRDGGPPGRYEEKPFGELIVAEPMRMERLPEFPFEIKAIKGSRMAFFGVHTGDDPRDKQPRRHFLPCRGIRVQNVLNPNFMLQTRSGPNGRPEEVVVPRQPPMGHEFSALLHQRECTTFYESFIGYLPQQQLMRSFPNGHPHLREHGSVAISFHWSWEPDYAEHFTVENILGAEEHPKGMLTMCSWKRIVAQRQSLRQKDSRKSRTESTDGGPSEKKRAIVAKEETEDGDGGWAGKEEQTSSSEEGN